MAKRTEMLRVRNWRKFQHYKDRTPPWIKLHWELLSSEDWVMLDDASKLLAIACMLIASRNEGLVPNNPAYIKRVAYLDKLPNLSPLIECGFLENPLAEDSESKQEQAIDTTETETDTEVEEEKSSEANASGASAPQVENNVQPIRPQQPAKPLDSVEAEVFREGRRILGRSAGGMVTNLRKSQGFDDRAVLALLREAEGKASPREWVGAVIRGEVDAPTPEHILYPPDIYRNVL